MLQLWKDELRVYRRHDVDGMTLSDRVFRASGFYAVRLHRVAHFCALQGWTGLADAVVALSHRCTGIRIHAMARVGKRVYLEKGVELGADAIIVDDQRVFAKVAEEKEREVLVRKTSLATETPRTRLAHPQEHSTQAYQALQERLAKTQQAIKELARVTKEQNRVIAKLNDRVVALGGEPIRELPNLHTQNMGIQVSLRRARRKPRRKTTNE